MFSLSGRDPLGPHSPGQMHLAGPSPGGYLSGPGLRIPIVIG